MKSKKSLLAELTAEGAAVTATIVGPMTTLDEWPVLEARLISDGWTPRNGGAVYDSPSGTGSPCRFVSKPKLLRVRTGRFTAAATSNYTFTWLDAAGESARSGGKVVDLKVSGDALELTMFNDCKIRYTLGALA